MPLVINFPPLNFFIYIDKVVIMQQMLYISICVEFHKERYMVYHPVRS